MNPQGLAVDAAQIFVELEIVSVPIFHGKFLTKSQIRVDLHRVTRILKDEEGN